MKKLIALLICVVLMNCEIKPHGAQAQGSDNLQVLAQKGLCTLYKYNDGGHTVYWSVCRVSSYTSSVSSY